MKLGVFGGTFDPVHNAHLFVAEGARVALGLQRVLFVPSKGIAHRDDAPSAPAQDRVAMIRLAIAANPAFGVDETDLAPNATGYTADLLPLLRARYPNDHLTFIVGGDSLVESPWERLNDVLDLLDAFAIAPRANRSLEHVRDLRNGLSPERAAKVLVVDMPSLGESATLVREQLARGGSVRYVVPEPVWRYIGEHGLYRKAA